MPQSLTSQLLHIVFSTKERRPMISPELAERLYPYLGGIAREYKMKLLAVGGMPDHVHLLISISATLSVAKAVQLLKGSSSKWIHETFENHRHFEWQRGYGAFSIGVADIERTIKYIQDQKKHHSKKTFEDEYISFVKRNGVDYDKRYIFD